MAFYLPVRTSAAERQLDVLKTCEQWGIITEHREKEMAIRTREQMIRGIRRMAELRSSDSTLATGMETLENEDWLRFLTLEDWSVLKRLVLRRTAEDDQWLQHLMAEDWSTLKRLVLERTAVGLMQPM